MPAFGTADIVFRYADGFKLDRFAGEHGKTVFSPVKKLRRIRRR